MSSAVGSIEKLAIDTIRTLSMDGVQAANSGHPGTDGSRAGRVPDLDRLDALHPETRCGLIETDSCSVAVTPRCLLFHDSSVRHQSHRSSWQSSRAALADLDTEELPTTA